MQKYIFPFILFISLATITTLISREFRTSQIPNGQSLSCNGCHTNGGGTPRNNFGKQIEFFHMSASGSAGNVEWTPLLASLDADNDGITNGQELQDPFGLSTENGSTPGNTSLVSAPGSANSTSYKTLTISFSGMTPHDSQTLHLSIYDRTSMKVVDRIIQQISDSFIVESNSLLVGHSYYINFFADHNGNDLYDVPPTDHAWQLELDEVDGNETLDFAHNTNFVDIDWMYNLKINFTGMTPHEGQLLEARIIESSSGNEAGRKRIEFIPSANFELNLPILENNTSYVALIYADQNSNSQYDIPPTDHAWEFEFTTVEGDFEHDFEHNTNFTDIFWSNEYKLNMISMDPHIGQMLYARLTTDSDEISMKSTIVPASDFTISLPGLVDGQDFNIDFFADVNGNGEYDAPPTDHAWRQTISGGRLNIVENFTHNTNFTDIEWKNVTDINTPTDNIVADFELAQNYPNPFNPSTIITYEIPVDVLSGVEAQRVNLTVYDILGKQIKTLVNENKHAGTYSVNFSAGNLPSGTYIYRLVAGNNSISKKMVLLR